MDAAQVSRALVVEDDDGLAQLIKMCFVDNEVGDIVTVDNGSAAIGMILKNPPDIVMLDVDLPGLSGLEVLALMRLRGIDSSVIVTTGYGSEEVAIEALRLGADDYLRKPFSPAECSAVLARVLARLHLKRQNEALSRQLEAQRILLERELARAAGVQADLLPADCPQLPGMDIAAACRPAEKVGGDFYDWQTLPNGRLSLTIGDVMGKGISAALLMATARAVVRALASDLSPARVIQRASQALDGDLTRSGSFITMFHAQLDMDTWRLRYVDAGHGYVVLRRRSGKIEHLRSWGLPLGVDALEMYREGVVTIQPGDTVIVYSDGLTEARPDLFGDRKSVARQAGQHRTAASLVDRLVTQATEVGPLPDDLTVVVLRRADIEVVGTHTTLGDLDVMAAAHDRASAA
jgi:phosphoserine phosphatase RsbU/P